MLFASKQAGDVWLFLFFVVLLVFCTLCYLAARAFKSLRNWWCGHQPTESCGGKCEQCKEETKGD